MRVEGSSVFRASDRRLALARAVEGKPRAASRAGKIQQEGLHLGREGATRRLLPGKAKDPVHKGTCVAGNDDAIEVNVEVAKSHVGLHDFDPKAHKRVETQTGGNLDLTIAPTDRQDLAAGGKD